MATNTSDVNVTIKVNADNSMKSVRAMRQDMQNLMKAMDEAGERGDKPLFDKLSAELGQLKNDIVDTNARLKMLDPGEVLAGFTKLAQGAIGAFAGISGGLALVTDDQELLNKVQEKSTIIIQMMMGLEEARQILIDQGGKAQIKALFETIALQYKSIQARVTEAITIKTVEGATGMATKAQLIWNAAVKAMMGPLGWIIAGVTALGTGVYFLVKALDEEAKATNTVNGELEDYNAAHKLINERLEYQIKLMEAAGASEMELLNRRKLSNDISKELALKEFERLKNQRDEFEKNTTAWKNLNNAMTAAAHNYNNLKEEGQKIEEEINIQRVADNKETNDKIKADNIEAAKKSAEADKKLQEERVKNEKWSEEQIALIGKSITERQKEIAAAKKQDIADEYEYQIWYENHLAMLKIENAEKEKEAAKVKAEEEAKLRQEKFDADVAAAIQWNENFKMLSDIAQGEELKSAEGNEKKLKAIKKKYALINAGLAITDIAINTAVAVSKVMAQTGFVSPLLIPGIIASGALQVAAVGVETAKISKMAKGGLIQGPTHSQGGVMKELEGGESVVNARSTQMFKPLLSQINVAGGGVPFGNINNNNSVITATIDEQTINTIVNRVVSIPVNVVETDITRTQRKVNVIQTKTTIG